MFNYKGFIIDLTSQVVKVLPDDLSAADREYIEKAVKYYALLIGEAIADSKDFSDEQKEIIIQFVSEWIFHKGIDLCRAKIEPFNRNQILKLIAFQIAEMAKDAYKKELETDEIVILVESEVNKIYKEEIHKLKISQQKKENALNQSNIQKMIKDDLKQNKNRLKQEKIDSTYNCISWLIVVILYLSAVFYFGHSIYFYVTAIFAGIVIFNYFANKEINKQFKELENIRNEFQKLMEIETFFNFLETDNLLLEIGTNIFNKIYPDITNELLKIVSCRKRLALELGYIIPFVRIKDNPTIGENCYNFYSNGIKISGGEISSDTIGISEVFDKIINDFEIVVIENADKVLTIKHTYEYVDFVKKEYSEKIANDVLNSIGIIKIKCVLSKLIQKNFSIKNIGYIFEQIYIYGQNNAESDEIAEKIRVSNR